MANYPEIHSDGGTSMEFSMLHFTHATGILGVVEVPPTTLYSVWYFTKRTGTLPCNYMEIHYRVTKIRSPNTNFNLERNFANVSTRCSSLLQGESQNIGKVSFRIKVGIQRAFLCYARAN